MAQIIRRVIGCQGSIQLLTALSVVFCREAELKNSDVVYKNYLVIYDLYVPLGQDEAFAAFIQKLAQHVCKWEKITYVRPEKIKHLEETARIKSIQEVFDLVGVSDAEEIYLARNWQSGNLILINAFHCAKKICYGDSIGCYIAQPGASKKYPDNLTAYWFLRLKKSCKHLLRQLKSSKESNYSSGYVFKQIEFDLAYMMLPTGMGDQPNIPVIIPEKKWILMVFSKVKASLNFDYISQIYDKIKGKPIVILLTSNFSEGGFLFCDDELTAYTNWLTSASIDFENSVLLIKPHPRDSYDKIHQLQIRFNDVFPETILLDDLRLFFMPFEIILQSLLHELDGSHPISLFAVSSACISLKFLYQVPVEVGFGENLTSKYFFPSFVESRLKHESCLRNTISHL